MIFSHDMTLKQFFKSILQLNDTRYSLKISNTSGIYHDRVLEWLKGEEIGNLYLFIHNRDSTICKIMYCELTEKVKKEYGNDNFTDFINYYKPMLERNKKIEKFLTYENDI